MSRGHLLATTLDLTTIKTVLGNMSDAEVEELTGGMTAVKTSPKLMNRPASPIIDIYGDEEDSFDQGGNINVSDGSQ